MSNVMSKALTGKHFTVFETLSQALVSTSTKWELFFGVLCVIHNLSKLSKP